MKTRKKKQRSKVNPALSMTKKKLSITKSYYERRFEEGWLKQRGLIEHRDFVLRTESEKGYK